MDVLGGEVHRGEQPVDLILRPPGLHHRLSQAHRVRLHRRSRVVGPNRRRGRRGHVVEERLLVGATRLGVLVEGLAVLPDRGGERVKIGFGGDGGVRLLELVTVEVHRRLAGLVDALGQGLELLVGADDLGLLLGERVGQDADPGLSEAVLRAGCLDRVVVVVELWDDLVEGHALGESGVLQRIEGDLRLLRLACVNHRCQRRVEVLYVLDRLAHLAAAERTVPGGRQVAETFGEAVSSTLGPVQRAHEIA